MADLAGGYDIFLSHARPDKPWVEALNGKLEALGLRVWLDKDEIDAGDNWVIKLFDGLETNRCAMGLRWWSRWVHAVEPCEFDRDIMPQ